MRGDSNENYASLDGLMWRRLEKGYSQTGLAEACGLTQQQISRYESQPVCPHIPTLQKLATALDCRVKDLFTRLIEP